MRKLLVLLLIAMPAFGFSQSITKEKADNDGIIRCRCSNSAAPVKPLIFINGYELDIKHLSKVNPNQIMSIHIVKEKKEIDEYGEKAKGGIIKITTKKESFTELVKEGLIKPIL